LTIVGTGDVSHDQLCAIAGQIATNVSLYCLITIVFTRFMLLNNFLLVKMKKSSDNKIVLRLAELLPTKPASFTATSSRIETISRRIAGSDLVSTFPALTDHG